MSDAMSALREYVDDPGNWSALDGRRRHILGLIDAVEAEVAARPAPVVSAEDVPPNDRGCRWCQAEPGDWCEYDCGGTNAAIAPEFRGDFDADDDDLTVADEGPCDLVSDCGASGQFYSQRCERARGHGGAHADGYGFTWPVADEGKAGA